MRYVFRADASHTIGSGHVMRSSAIAEEFISRGMNTIFVGSITELDWVAQRIRGLGFSEIYNFSREFLPNKDTDVLVLDSYDLEKDDPFVNPNTWHSVVTIVDSVTPAYLCSLRIHPGLDSDWYQDRKIPLLYGPEYIPLRREISLDEVEVRSGTHPLSIIVLSGGTDAFGLVSVLASLLKNIEMDFKAFLFTDMPVQVTLDHRFEIVPIGSTLDILSRNADLVFTTASTSSLEFIARGLPVAILCAVQNQVNNYEKLGALGVALQAGSRNPDETWDLNRDLIIELVCSPNIRKQLSSRACSYIDKSGSSRIVDAIIAL